MRVCLGIFTTALRNEKKKVKFSIKIPHIPQCIACYLVYFSYALLLRKMVISQLEVGPPLVIGNGMVDLQR